jgi:hypothetical protein
MSVEDDIKDLSEAVNKEGSGKPDRMACMCCAAVHKIEELYKLPGDMIICGDCAEDVYG